MNGHNLGLGMEAAAQNPQIFENPAAPEQTGVMPEQAGMTPERAGEAQIAPNQEQQGLRPMGLENAMGVATVGATGVAAPLPQMTTAAPLAGPEVKADENQMGQIPEDAKDGERIEKAWIERAQQLVRDTKDDPNKRLVQTALLREEYMRKRFNRILGEHN